MCTPCSDTPTKADLGHTWDGVRYVQWAWHAEWMEGALPKLVLLLLPEDVLLPSGIQGLSIPAEVTGPRQATAFPEAGPIPPQTLLGIGDAAGGGSPSRGRKQQDFEKWFDWIPEHYRVGPWSPVAREGLFPLLLLLLLLLLLWWRTVR